MKQKLRLTDKVKCNLGSQTHKAKMRFIYNLREPLETQAFEKMKEKNIYIKKINIPLDNVCLIAVTCVNSVF